MSRKERSAIIESAVPIIEKHLYDNTPYDEFEDVKNKKLYGESIGHLRDHITHKPNQFINGAPVTSGTQNAASLDMIINYGRNFSI